MHFKGVKLLLISLLKRGLFWVASLLYWKGCSKFLKMVRPFFIILDAWIEKCQNLKQCGWTCSQFPSKIQTTRTWKNIVQKKICRMFSCSANESNWAISIDPLWSSKDRALSNWIFRKGRLSPKNVPKWVDLCQDYQQQCQECIAYSNDCLGITNRSSVERNMSRYKFRVFEKLYYLGSHATIPYQSSWDWQATSLELRTNPRRKIIYWGKLYANACLLR